MTQTPLDWTGGDLKAHADPEQNAHFAPLCRGVWPIAPMQPSTLPCTFKDAHRKSQGGKREFFRGVLSFHYLVIREHVHLLA